MPQGVLLVLSLLSFFTVLVLPFVLSVLNSLSWTLGAWTNDSVGNKTNKPNGPLTSVLRNFDKLYPAIVKDYDYPITKSCL